MDAKQTEMWLIKESSKGNELAKAYLGLLENATPEMRVYWYNLLGSALNGLASFENLEKDKNRSS